MYKLYIIFSAVTAAVVLKDSTLTLYKSKPRFTPQLNKALKVTRVSTAKFTKAHTRS